MNRLSPLLFVASRCSGLDGFQKSGHAQRTRYLAGGYPLNVRNCPTICRAGTIVQSLSRHQQAGQK